MIGGERVQRRGLLIILSSPSGAGKSTLARRLRDWDSSIRFSVSATTRAARPGETDGADYRFVSETDFKQMVGAGQMLEHAHVFDIDWQGAQQIQTSALKGHVLSIFLLPPSITELQRRLESRGQDTDETIRRRMQKSWDEISHWDAYDYVLINDDLDATEAKLKTIVTAERLRASQQPGVIDHVRALQAEFEGQT